MKKIIECFEIKLYLFKYYEYLFTAADNTIESYGMVIKFLFGLVDNKVNTFDFDTFSFMFNTKTCIAWSKFKIMRSYFNLINSKKTNFKML